MALKNVAEAWSILQQEIENQSDAGVEMGTIVKGNQTVDEIRNVRRDPKAEAIKALASGFSVEDPVTVLKQEIEGNMVPYDMPPIDPRDMVEEGTVDLHDSHIITPVSTEQKDQLNERRGDIKMKKSIRIRKNGEQVNVRVFVGEEEFCGMCLTCGSENAISLGGARLMIQGDETILEI